jgi:hypothetical protein
MKVTITEPGLMPGSEHFRSLAFDAGDIEAFGRPDGEFIMGLSEEDRAVINDGLSPSDVMGRAFRAMLYLLDTDFAAQLLDPEPEVAGMQGSTPGTATASQVGAADLRRRLTLFIALVWLLAIGLPLAEAELSAGQQVVVTNEFATAALALAVTWRLIDDRKDR